MKNTMNKGGIIGIIVVIIIAIIVGASYFSSTSESDEGISIIEDLALEDLKTEEVISEEPETSGKEFSVEFSEKIGLKTP